jgi:hypothetical protein
MVGGCSMPAALTTVAVGHWVRLTKPEGRPLDYQRGVRIVGAWLYQSGQFTNRTASRSRIASS